MDAARALAAAQPVFDANGKYLGGPAVVSGARAGVFLVSIAPGDFGAFALVGAGSGAMIAAGAVTWGGGPERYWAPSTWRAPGALACGAVRAAPRDTFIDRSAECPPPYFASTLADAVPGTAVGALDVALRTNLAAHYAAREPFSALVYLYTPRVGACDATLAEYLVVLTHQ